MKNKKLLRTVTALCAMFLALTVPMISFAAATSDYEAQTYSDYGVYGNQNNISFAVIANGGVNMHDSFSIEGSVYSNGSINGSDGTVNGLIIGEGSIDSTVLSDGVVNDADTSAYDSYAGFTVPEGIDGVEPVDELKSEGADNLTISSDTVVNRLWNNGEPGIVIDATNNDVTIIVKEQYHHTSNTITVIGENKVNIYFAQDRYFYGTKVVSEHPENVNIYMKADTGITIFNRSNINANVYVDAPTFTLNGNSSITGNVIALGSAATISNGIINGYLYTDTLDISNGQINYIASGGAQEEPIQPQPGELGNVVKYDVAAGEYSRGTMATKMHTPDGAENAHLNYEVLDENTFEVSGPQEVSDDIKADVQLILDTVNDTFISRKADPAVNLQWWRFGRIDSNGTSMTLSITPYSYQTIQAGGVDTMWLCWGDRDTEVETVWMVVE